MLSVGSLVLTEAEVLRRRRFFEITAADEERLRRVHPFLRAHAAEVIERFYDYLLAHEPTRRALSAPGLVERLKRVQERYFSELTAGSYDRGYFENRLRVGLAHDRAGIAPQWYVGAYGRYLQIASDVLARALAPGSEEYVATIGSLSKVIHLDMSLTLEAYFLSAQANLERKAVALEQANAEVVRLVRARQGLADVVVHDLQNPLAGIIAFLQVLRAEGSSLPGSHRAALEDALARCDDLSQMIRNLLQVSRAESGRLEVRLEDVDLVDLVRHAAASFRVVAQREGRVLAVETPAALPLRTDPSLVLRILGNLLRNACRHTPAGTRITLRASRLPAGGADISVADNGPGIPIHLQPILFDPLGAKALREAGLRVDTGLGLAFCKMAADALGASLAVQSDGQRGSTFTLSFAALQ